jgi:hypothetical protein
VIELVKSSPLSASLAIGGALLVIWAIGGPILRMGLRLIGKGSTTTSTVPKPDGQGSAPPSVWEGTPISAPPPGAVSYILAMSETLRREDADFVLECLVAGDTLHEALCRVYEDEE